MQGITGTGDTSEWPKMVEVIFSKIERNLFPSSKINTKRCCGMKVFRN